MQSDPQGEVDLQVLINRVYAGDNAALDELFTRSVPRMRAIVERFLRRSFRDLKEVQGASSAVSRIWIEAKKSFRTKVEVDRGKGTGPISVAELYLWLATLAWHTLTDAARKDAKRVVPGQGDTDNPVRHVVDFDSKADPGRAAEAGELLLKLAEAIAELPPIERAVVELAYYQDEKLTQEQIAEKLDLTQPQVSKLLAKAYARLGAVLPRDEP